jgi:5-formyltetrahydrofolate cyclo-ligase
MTDTPSRDDDEHVDTAGTADTEQTAQAAQAGQPARAGQPGPGPGPGNEASEVSQSQTSQVGNDDQMQRVLRVYAKRELRTRMKSVRNLLPDSAAAERSARACAALSALAELGSARIVAGYIAVRKELDVSAALARAADGGKQIVLPRIDEAGGLAFHVHVPGQPLVENDWGVLEPDPNAATVAIADIDLMLVPALALDLRGYRIGYGKGFYDHVLPQLTHGRAVGVVYDFQLLAEVPEEAHDQRVHFIVTDTRSLAAQ